MAEAEVPDVPNPNSAEASAVPEKEESPVEIKVEKMDLKSKIHIKRPMNASMVWAHERRRKMATDSPKMHHSNISKILGAEWKLLSPSEKQPFIEAAKKIHSDHMLAHPDYKYRPQRKLKPLQRKFRSHAPSSLPGPVAYSVISTPDELPDEIPISGVTSVRSFALEDFPVYKRPSSTGSSPGNANAAQRSGRALASRAPAAKPHKSWPLIGLRSPTATGLKHPITKQPIGRSALLKSTNTAAALKCSATALRSASSSLKAAKQEKNKEYTAYLVGTKVAVKTSIPNDAMLNIPPPLVIKRLPEDGTRKAGKAAAK